MVIAPTFDDFEQLYAAGRFTIGPSNSMVAAWDGSSWSAVGNGPILFGNDATALAVYNDGGGAALYAAGGQGSNSGAVSKWDGSSWTNIGQSDAIILALEVFNGDLYAAGRFTDIGGSTFNRIAKWDGSSWSAVGTGTDQQIVALGVHNDGNGAALYAGGDFVTAGGSTANRVAKWSGSAWSAVGNGLDDGSVWALHSFNDGGGSKLYAGGTFFGPSNPNGVTSWDG